jgi:flagellar biosynthesis regulator FlaF
MSETTERETELITGTITAIVQKAADKWQVVVQPDGSQYDKNLWTKSAETVDALSKLIGEHRAFVCSVSHWTNNDGKPIRSLWLDHYTEQTESPNPTTAVAHPAPNANAGSASPQTQKADVDWDAKERRNYRSKAWAQVLGAMSHTIKVDEDPKDVFLRLQPLQRKIYEDVCGTFAYPTDDSDVPF